MALGDYTPTAWANGTTPAINATNLGHIETKIDEIDAASAATSSTRIWSTSNDGNGGQPPDPKSNTNGSSGSYSIGRELGGKTSAGQPLYHSGTTNETGTWRMYFYVPSTYSAGVYLGSGSITGSLAADIIWFSKRIS